MQILLKDAAPIQVEAVVRVVPQQREVVRGTWRDAQGVVQQVYAKKFTGKRAYRHFQRDLAGVSYLRKANILTPPLLFQGPAADDEAAYVAVFAAIAPAQNAEVVWAGLTEDISSTEARFQLAKQLVLIVAAMHSAGLLQTDLYLKNFLVQGSTVYALDGDGMRPLTRFFSKQQRLKNLATLFSKMDALEDAWLPALYQAYCDAMHTPYSQAAAARIASLTQQIRYRVATGYADKKVFRTCTDVKVSRSFSAYTAIAAGFVAGVDIASLDPLLADTQHNIKNGNTCTVAKAELAGKPVIIKRYNIKSFWHGLGRAFRHSRAAKSWANAYRLNILNIATAQPLALLEERIGCLRRRAYFLSAYVDAPDALQYFAQASTADKAQAAQQLASLFYKLYLLKISHGDFKASNVKIVNQQPLLIDLDSMQAHSGLAGYWFEHKHIKDLKRFMKNWQDNAEIRTLLKQAFVLKYSPQPALLKLLQAADIA